MNMSIKEKLLNYYPNSEFFTVDGFDNAIIGVTDNDIVVYSIKKIINILTDGGLTEEDALEFFYYNVSTIYVGEMAPIWVYDDFLTIK